jgi:surfactin synthase thioesterase subunit
MEMHRLVLAGAKAEDECHRADVQRRFVCARRARAVDLQGLLNDAQEDAQHHAVALHLKLARAGHLKPSPVMLGHCLVAQLAFGVARVVALGLAGGVHECFVNTQNSADFPSAGLRSKTTPKGRYMPAVYKGDEKGNEALMNTNVIDGNS